MPGIDHTKKTIESLSTLVTDLVSVAISGIGFSTIPKLFQVAADIKEIASEIPQSLPELNDLDAQEAAQLGSAAYDIIKNIIVQLNVTHG